MQKVLQKFLISSCLIWVRSNISLIIFHKDGCILLFSSGEAGKWRLVQIHFLYCSQPQLSSGQDLAIKLHNLADFEQSQQLTLRLYGVCTIICVQPLHHSLTKFEILSRPERENCLHPSVWRWAVAADNCPESIVRV